MTIESVRSFVIRHRFAIRDLGVLLALFSAALYIAFAIDIFHDQQTVTLRQAEIELDEALLLGTLLAIGLLIFGVRQYLRQKRELAQRLAAEAEVRKLAFQDVLTGLPNRRKFDEMLVRALDAPPRLGAAHAVLLLDLNGFKSVNDIHGHSAGDEMLIVVAQRLLGAMRDGDMVARFGGDEFAILATHLSGSEAATNIALRVIEALEAPIEAAGAVHRVGAGIGIALVPSDAVTVEEAMRKADVALYRAKAERRSAHRFFEPAMDARIRERAAMERDLRAALEDGTIDVRFQPSLDLRTHKIVGFEVKPYWIHPNHGEVPIDRFVAIADEVGLIHRLGDHVLRRACAAAVHWPAHVGLSADLHASQLRDSLAAARIVCILEESGIAASRLEVELTESAFVADIDNAKIVLGTLRAAGIRIALDNFGTGYSSLYHLRNFRLDKIKIDRTFVREMERHSESANIVRALVGLGHGLGITVAADGIDGSDQESALVTTGCEQGQGDLIGEALDAEHATNLVRGDQRARRRSA